MPAAPFIYPARPPPPRPQSPFRRPRRCGRRSQTGAHAASARAHASARPGANNKAKPRRHNSGQGPPTPLQKHRVKYKVKNGSYQLWLARKNTPQSQRGATRSTISGNHPASQTTQVARTHDCATAVADSKAPPIAPCAKLAPGLRVPIVSTHNRAPLWAPPPVRTRSIFRLTGHRCRCRRQAPPADAQGNVTSAVGRPCHHRDRTQKAQWSVRG